MDELSHNDNAKFVITDVRFQNECDFIKHISGILLKVKRDLNIAMDDNHSSEIGIDNLSVDYDIINNDDFDHLYKCIEHIFK